jgi:diaminohydroxyphosphoribosylaminopyrimidine deaminase / 5-amino-6-(5-phosphoribosylamino)uracil reductase
MSGARPVDRSWLEAAIDLSRHCPPVDTAYAVGAIMVDRHGAVLTCGYSRETDPYAHAEEIALARLGPATADLPGATLYSSLEPCSARRSRPHPCAELVIRASIGRVVIAAREPPLFVNCVGVELLRAAGIEVVEITDLADRVWAVNTHLLASGSREVGGRHEG